LKIEENGNSFIVKFITGFLYGIIHEKYNDLDVCLAEAEVISLDVK